MRVYYDDTVPKPVVSALEARSVQMVHMRTGKLGGGIGGMFWRFLVAGDSSVDRFIVRDSDSRLNPRERLAVEEWIASGAKVHSLRDHPNHERPLNGGMWGGTRQAVPDMEALVGAWSNREQYMGDLDFLNQKVWLEITPEITPQIVHQRVPQVIAAGNCAGVAASRGAGLADGA